MPALWNHSSVLSLVIHLLFSVETWRVIRRSVILVPNTGKYVTGRGKDCTSQCHYDICEEYPLDCPNKCEAHDIKRKNMKRHREKCPLELLNCPFNYVGCTSTKQRRSMDQHCQQNMQEHLLLMAQSHQELAQKNKDLVSKN